MTPRRAVAALLITILAWPTAAQAEVAPAVPPSSPLPGPGEATGALELVSPTDPDTSAEVLYNAGEQAYWLGDFRRAVPLFEAAYARSGLPTLLYNVGLATMRRYELSQDPDDLRRARSVLTNYAQELIKDPTLQQADNVPKLIAQLDATLASLTAPPPVATPAPVIAEVVPEARCEPAPPPARGVDTRRVGAAVMSVGGLALAGGVATTVAFALKGQGFQQQQTRLLGEAAAAGCTGGAQGATCRALEESRSITVRNGQQANLLAGGLGGGLMALGVAGLVIGAVVFARAPAARGRLAIVPSVTPRTAGLVFAGRF
jgi:hypothetical protein